MTEEVQFQDADSYQSSFNKTLSFKDIVLQHLKTIGRYASVEFRGGYWEIRAIPIQGTNMSGSATSKVYVPDSREVYSNAIEYLADILYPHFDKEMKDKEEKIKKEIQQSFISNTIVEKEVEDNDSETEDHIRKFASVDQRITYRDQRVIHNRTLFRELCSFLYRQKYLEVGAISD